MRIPALTGLLLAAAATVVSAAPAKDETAERVSYTDETKPVEEAIANTVEIASPTPASHGRVFLTPDGRFSQLRIEGTKGRPVVNSVRVVYADGAQRVVKVRRALAGKQSLALVDLSGAAIDHVIVETDRRSKGTYTVRGVPSGGIATR